jgi:hypothetical protein
MASGVDRRQVNRVRKLLRRMPDEIRAGVVKEVRHAAETILEQQRRDAPHQSIARNLETRYSNRGLVARIGLVTKRAARHGFLARIFEFGAKPHQIKVHPVATSEGYRRSLAIAPDGRFLGKVVQHKGMKARPFMFIAFRAKRAEFRERFRKAIGEALRRAGAGV